MEMVRQKPIRKSFRISIPSDPRNIHLAEEFLARVNRAAHFDEIEYHKILVALTEAVNNAILHGNQSDASKNVHVMLELSPRRCIVRVRDNGKGFDISAVPSPIHDERLFKETGRGIFLMRVLADDVSFSHIKSGFEVRLAFRRRRKFRAQWSK